MFAEITEINSITEISKSSKIDFLDKLRSELLNALFVPLSSRWYREVLSMLPSDISLLDIGIGTAASLIASRDIVKSKNIHVTGVDYCQGYLEHAKRAITESSIKDQVDLVCGNIHDFNSNKELTFDVAYFSASFMIIPNQSEALKHTVSMLRPRKFKKDSREGNIFFTQTFENATWMGRHITPHLKKLLTAVTTIDFGVVTFEHDFRAALERANVEIVEMKTLRSSYFRKEVLVVARPRSSN